VKYDKLWIIDTCLKAKASGCTEVQFFMEKGKDHLYGVHGRTSVIFDVDELLSAAKKGMDDLKDIKGLVET